MILSQDWKVNRVAGIMRGGSSGLFSAVEGTACFGGYNKCDLIYFVRPKCVSAIMPREDVDIYLSLLDKAKIAPPIDELRVKSKEEYEELLNNWKVNDNAEVTWKQVTEHGVIPVRLQPNQFTTTHHALAYLTLLRYVDDYLDTPAAMGAVKLFKQYGEQFTPFQYIVFGHHFSPGIAKALKEGISGNNMVYEVRNPKKRTYDGWPEPGGWKGWYRKDNPEDLTRYDMGGTGHCLLANSFVNPPKEFFKGFFDKGVQANFIDHFRVGFDTVKDELKLTVPAGYHYYTPEFSTVLEELTLPKFVEVLNSKLDPSKVDPEKVLNSKVKDY